MRWLLRQALVPMLPASAEIPGADGDLHGFVTRFRADAGWLMWIGAVASAVAFVCSPLITVGIPLPSFLLTRRARDRHAHNMAMHRLYWVRQAAFLLKLIVALHWAARPEVRVALGLPPYGPDPDTWRTT